MNKSYVLIKPGWKERRYLLRVGNEEVGRLELEGVCSTHARVYSQKNEWIFDRTGVLEPVVTVRRADDGADLLVATMRLGGDCDVTLESGDVYHWKSTSVWRGEFAWVSEDGAAAIRYRPRVSSRSIEQHIEVLTDDLPADTERLLVFLGGYFATLTYSDVATTSAVIVAATLVS